MRNAFDAMEGLAFLLDACGFYNGQVDFSPMFDKEKPVIGSQLVNWILEDKLDVRVQLQR